MATLVRLMADDPDPRFSIRVVPTFVDASLIRRLWTGVSGILTVAALMLAGRVDVLHIHLSHGGSVLRKSILLLVARIRNVPAIVHGHSSNFAQWMNALPRIAHRAVRAGLPADHYLALGRSLADEYRLYLGLDHARVRVMYNPVVLPTSVSPPCSQRPLRALSLGKLGARKGTYELVDAIGLLPNSVRADLSLTLAGDGEVEQMREYVRSRRLDDTVEITGWVTPATRDRLLSSAAIFVLPSHDEGLPMAILEAMAYGVVPVVTPVGAIPEVITDGVDGLLVQPGDVQKLAKALQSLLTDDELRNRLGESARARAAEFDIVRWRDALRELWISSVAERFS